MSQPKVLFFDAAGTLFRIKESVAEVYLAYAGKYGVTRTDDLLVRVQSAFARAFQDAPPPVFAASEPHDLKRCERLWWFDIVHNVFYRVGMFERFDEYFDEIYEAFAGPTHWTLYPDTVEVLHRLRALGLELGIVSNFDTRLFGILRALGIVDLFDTVTISSIARAAKPSPRIFQVAIEKHAVEPDECWHVGDSVRDDVEGAHHAGVHPILLAREDVRVRTGPALPSPIPTIRTLFELEALLEADRRALSSRTQS